MNKFKNNNNKNKEMERIPQQGYIDNTSINKMYHKMACTLRDMQSKVLKESNFQVTGNHTKKFMKKQELPNNWGQLHQLFRSQFSKLFSMHATGSRAWLPSWELSTSGTSTRASLKGPIQELRNKGQKSI